MSHMYKAIVLAFSTFILWFYCLQVSLQSLECITVLHPCHSSIYVLRQDISYSMRFQIKLASLRTVWPMADNEPSSVTDANTVMNLMLH